MRTTIQIERKTQEKLKTIGTMEDTYDSVINKLIEEHETLKRLDFFVETQHNIAEKGKFLRLD